MKKNGETTEERGSIVKCGETLSERGEVPVKIQWDPPCMMVLWKLLNTFG